MADKRIRDFTQANTLDGTELVHVDQATADKRSTVASIRNYGDTEGQTQTVGNYGYASNEGEDIFSKFGSNDANAINRSGLYYIDSSTANKPSRFAGISSIQHVQTNTSYAEQIMIFMGISEATNIAENIIANRYKVAGSWTAWEYSDTKARQAITKAKDEMFPVGSTYIVTGAQDPNNFLEGTWVKFGQGRTLIGEGTLNDGQVERTFNAGATGGLYNATLSENHLPSHTHSIDSNNSDATAQTQSSGSHSHTPDGGGNFLVKGVTTNSNRSGSGENVKEAGTTSTAGSHEHNLLGSTSSVGDNDPFSTQNPYLTVVFWTRTA